MGNTNTIRSVDTNWKLLPSDLHTAIERANRAIGVYSSTGSDIWESAKHIETCVSMGASSETIVKMNARISSFTTSI